MRKYICKNCSIEFISNKGCKTRMPLFCSKKCSAIYNLSLDTVRKKISESHKGKEAWNKGINMWKDKEHPKGTKGMKFPQNAGENNKWWKGGISNINEIERKSANYKNWRKSVFERDNYTCVICNKKGGKIHADHIKPFSKYIELRYDINNGRTLCIDCHIKTDTYGGKMINYGNTAN